MNTAGGEQREPDASFPSPALAGGLTLGAIFATSLLFLAFVPTMDPLASRALAVVMGTGAIGVLAALRVPPPHGERVGLRGINAGAVLGVALLIPVALLSSEVDNWARALLGGPAAFGEAGVAPRTAALWVQTLVVLVGIEPVIEEWFFRGVLQQGSRDRLGPRGSVIWCAFLFAAYAVSGRFSGGADAVAIGLQSFALGVAFGFVRAATGSLLAPVLLHSAINAIAIVGGTLFPIAGFTAPGSHTDPVLLVGAAVSVVLGVKQLETAASSAQRGEERKDD